MTRSFVALLCLGLAACSDGTPAKSIEPKHSAQDAAGSDGGAPRDQHNPNALDAAARVPTPADDEQPPAVGSMLVDADAASADAVSASDSGSPAQSVESGTSAFDGGLGDDASGVPLARADGGSVPIDWSDVVPDRMRLGPQTAPRELFNSKEQFGAFWETPDGNVLTSFRTSVTQPVQGVATYDYHYTLQTVVDGEIQQVPELDVGTCRYEDWPYGSCSVGLDPDGPSSRSLVANDGSMLLVIEKPIPDSKMYPSIELIDPNTGTTSPLLELTDFEMPRSSAAFTARFALQQLADGTLALATETNGVPARTVVFDTTGARLAVHDGFAFGERWKRFALLLGESSGNYNQRFDWWDPRGAALATAFVFPEVTPAPAHRTVVTPVGDLIFLEASYPYGLIHVDEDGAVVEDKELPNWGFLASLPDGSYVTLEKDDVLGYVLKMYDRAGRGDVIYDEATLLLDASWPKLRTSVNETFPHIAPLEFGAVVDDAGNFYVGFVLQTDGEVSRTHIGAFAPDGHRLWGWNLETVSPGTCLPDSILSGHRLVARCFGRYLRRFVILGE